MNKFIELLPIGVIDHLPINYRFVKSANEYLNKNKEDLNYVKFIRVESYNTTSYMTEVYYKPISKSIDFKIFK